MRLWIVRHGKAEPAACPGRDDDRALIERGVEQARYLAWRLASAPAPDLIVSSPIRRAVETAEVLRAAVGAPIEFDPRLRTGCEVDEALAAVRERTGLPSLMIVGHNPQLEEMIAYLLDERARASAPFRTGEAALMELKPAAPRRARAVLLERVRMDGDDSTRS